MKKFTISAVALPSGLPVCQYVWAFNLRDAWDIFKLRNSNYDRLRFQFAFTRYRYYFKVN